MSSPVRSLSHAVKAASIANKGQVVDVARKALQMQHHISVGISTGNRKPAIAGISWLTLQDFQDAITSLERARQPVIAALYGHSLGLAVDIASACDIRLAAADVVLGIMVGDYFQCRRSPPPLCTLICACSHHQEVKVGLAADIGTLQRLPKIVGNGSKARELAMTGRKFGAAEAKEIGFVSDVIPGSRQEVICE